MNQILFIYKDDNYLSLLRDFENFYDCRGDIEVSFEPK